MKNHNNQYMREAHRLAKENVARRGGGPFGAVIVKKGKIIARGWNKVIAMNDPTAHAEIVAIREACIAIDSFELKECELYASSEPCPMCLGAIYWTRLKAVYYGNTATQAAAIGFDDEFIYKELKKKIQQRKLRMNRIVIAGALDAFRAWKNKKYKIRY